MALGTDHGGFGRSGTFEVKGKDVERHLYYLGLGPQPNYTVDSEPPTVSSVRVSSRPDNGTAYGVEWKESDITTWIETRPTVGE